MHQTEESQIVRYVNTFTVADWEARKPNDRMRKGITRVTKSNSQSLDRFFPIKQKHPHEEIIPDQNEDYSNRNKLPAVDHTSTQYLLQRIKNLEMELTILQKQKIEFARKLQENAEQKPKQHLIESHYITCKQDIEQMMSERNQMLQTIRSLQNQINFLKININIQQQYIIKVQNELDLLKTERKQQSVHIEQSIQTQQQFFNQVQAQTQINEYLDEYSYLKDLATQFQNQTSEFALIIQKLEQEKHQLLEQNELLTIDLQKTKEFVQINDRELKEMLDKLKTLADNEQKMKQQLLSVQFLFQRASYDLKDANQQIQKTKNDLLSANNIIFDLKGQAMKQAQKLNSLKKQLQKLNQQLLRQQARNHEPKQYKNVNFEVSKQQVKDINSNRQFEQRIKHQQQSFSLKIKHYQERIQAERKFSTELINNKNKEIEELKELNKYYTAQSQQLKQEILYVNQSYQLMSNKLRKSQEQVQILNTQLVNKQTQIQKLNHNISKQVIKVNSLKLQLLRFSDEKKRQIQLKQQILQKEYSKYKQQFDDLLLYLDQKSDVLKQKEQLILHQIQSNQIISHTNQENRKAKQELSDTINHYEQRIKRIQSSLEQYVGSLMVRRKTQNDQQISNLMQRLQVQKQINQRQKVYLLNKIQDLEKQLISKQKLQKQTLEEKQIMVGKLGEQIIELSNKYQQQVHLNNQLKRQSIFLVSALKQEELKKIQINMQIEDIKNEYNYQINQMQSNIGRLEDEIQKLAKINQQIKQSNQLRLVQVKKDYDILYSKYIKYKTISKALQEQKPSK